MRINPCALRACFAIAAAAASPFLPVGPGRAEESHAIAMHGRPALPADFSHLPYVNPDAPKGGRLVWGLPGTFDSLNPFIVKGLAPPQIRGYVIESLLSRSNDEAFTLYAGLARSVESDDERQYVTFRIDPRARFSDGTPVLADDVRFSWEVLRDHGRPNYRQYYAKVAGVEIPDPLTIRFDLAGVGDRELPLILGLMPILPRHATDADRFEETSLRPPVGSGPYRVSAVNPGASVTLSRNPDYWGRDLPVNRGLYNFDEIRLDFYREANSQFEAFRRGLHDFRVEHEPLRWHDGYDFPAMRRGEIVRDVIRPGVPQPAEFLVFNTRRAVFADIRVRQALTLLFDFDWINRNYFFGYYSRAGGYFPGSELSAYGRDADSRERELLEPFRGHLRSDIIDGSYRLPSSDGSGQNRAALAAALKLLAEAGYDLEDTVLCNRSTKRPFTFEILVTTRDQERVALAYLRDLKRAGIVARVRNVDPVQYDQRRINFDFDMIENRGDQSLSPGNEQFFYWGSAAADAKGTRNYMGARDPAVDAMINALLAARDRTSFVPAVRALDRVLMSGFYAIPLYNVPEQWIARWNRIKHPATTALTGYLPETWWARQPGEPVK
ncbi:MAG: extracellular solute-binding protein [Alphaproteobacteria bacterium]|nr:extracellular solute-binding protein [Alphaproteobacteria bacterium]